MYVRTTRRANKDGSVVGYVQLAHNRRGGGTTKAEVLVNLGREDRLDVDGVRRLARSINRYLGEDAASGAGTPEPVDGDAACRWAGRDRWGRRGSWTDCGAAWGLPTR